MASQSFVLLIRSSCMAELVVDLFRIIESRCKKIFCSVALLLLRKNVDVTFRYGEM